MYYIKGDVNKFLDYLYDCSPNYYIQALMIDDNGDCTSYMDKRLKGLELTSIADKVKSKSVKTFVFFSSVEYQKLKDMYDSSRYIIFVTDAWDSSFRRMKYTDLFDNTVFEIPDGINI